MIASGPSQNELSLNLSCDSIDSATLGEAIAVAPVAVVVGYAQHREYHGCFAVHPAATPLIDFNTANQSTMQLLECFKKADIAKQVIARRGNQCFADIGALRVFLKHFTPPIEMSEQDEKRLSLVRGEG
jgi:hypothetical protein